MKPTSKTFSASAATLFSLALLTMAAPAAKADDFCITSGAQAAHGCGYPTMEACHAATAGMGGICAPSASNKSPSDALNYQPKQKRSRNQPKQPASDE
jgi:hypothetical protein